MFYDESTLFSDIITLKIFYIKISLGCPEEKNQFYYAVLG